MLTQTVTAITKTVPLCDSSDSGLSWNRDGTCAETRFRLSRETGRVHLNRPMGASVQLTSGRRGVRTSGSNAGYAMFRGSVKSTGYPLQSTVSPSLTLPCVTVCHHISTGLYHQNHTRVLSSDIRSPARCCHPTQNFWNDPRERWVSHGTILNKRIK
jgi:hypothetical protein